MVTMGRELQLMEEEPSVAVCACRVKLSATQKPEIEIQKTLPLVTGLIEYPLLDFMQGNCIMYPTAMIRKTFLSKKQLLRDIEDFKLWVEIAKQGGLFYVDTQTLLYCYTTDNSENEEQQSQLSETVINEIVEFLTYTNEKNCPELRVLLENFRKLKDKELMTQQDIVIGFFLNFFTKNKDHLNMKL